MSIFIQPEEQTQEKSIYDYTCTCDVDSIFSQQPEKKI